MASEPNKPKPYRYKRALQEMAEDVRGQCALEKHQRETGVATPLIDRVRAKSYKRIALQLQQILGVDLGVEPTKF